MALAIAMGTASCSQGSSDNRSVAPCPVFSDLSQGLPVTRGWRTNPSLADVNGDGYLDLAATNRKGEGPKVFLYDPAKGWLPSSEGIRLDMYSCGVGVELKDVTGDARIDLLVADHCTGLYLFQGDGQGRWERVVKQRHPSGEGFNDASAGDLNGDGRTDLVALAAFTTGFSLFEKREDGSFAGLKSGLPRSGGGYEVGLADLDGDGMMDIYATLQGTHPGSRARGEREAKVWLQKPGGTWEAGSGLPETGNFYGMAAGDINKDGFVDLVLSRTDYEGGVLVFLGKGQGVWELLAGSQPGEAPGRLMAGVALSDLDQDGNLDLIAVERTKPAVVAWIGDGSGKFTECGGGPVLPRSEGPGWGLAVGDVTKDGHPDVVAGFGSEAGGALKAWATRPPAR